MSSFSANAIECEGVVYFCVTVRDLVSFAIGSFRVWIACMVGKFSVSMLDLVRLAIGSWSPVELIVIFVFFGIVSVFCWTTPLEVMVVWFSWSPLEVSVGYLFGATSCLGMSGGTGFLGGLDSSVCQSANIVWTASIAASYKS